MSRVGVLRLSTFYRRRRLTPLFWRVLITNTLLLVIAPLVVTWLHPLGRRGFDPRLVLVAAVPLLVLWLVNLSLLRGALTPLRRLSEFADQVDLLHPGRRVELRSRTAEVVVLSAAINRMLARVEEERRSSTRRTIAAQEAERRRIAQELHDEVGQTLTAVLLELDRAAGEAPPGLQERLTETLEWARSTLEDVRRIAVELRPEALEELGLPGALVTLCDRFEQQLGLAITCAIGRDLPSLTAEQELVIYRIAQEALTNVIRHSGSGTARLILDAREGQLSLEVIDHGRGLSGARHGAGVAGMRERANLVGGSLSIAEGARGGTIVHLTFAAGSASR